MNSFFKRLKYYGFGFLLGLLFVVFFFKNRGCSWLPGNRVKSAILERVIVVPETEKGLSGKDEVLRKRLENYLEKGKINFGESKKKNPNKYYKIDWKGHPSLFFTLPTESFVSAVYTHKPTSENLKGKAKMLLFPQLEDWIYMDTTDILSCQLLGLGFKDERHLQKEIYKNGTVNFDESNFKSGVKPEHSIELLSPKGSAISVKAIWYKNKINVRAFSFPDSLACE